MLKDLRRAWSHHSFELLISCSLMILSPSYPSFFDLKFLVCVNIFAHFQIRVEEIESFL
jgi:hypothetical protein